MHCHLVIQGNTATKFSYPCHVAAATASTRTTPDWIVYGDTAGAPPGCNAAVAIAALTTW
jgi:hypothetical protein